MSDGKTNAKPCSRDPRATLTGRALDTACVGDVDGDVWATDYGEGDAAIECAIVAAFKALRDEVDALKIGRKESQDFLMAAVGTDITCANGVNHKMLGPGCFYCWMDALRMKAEALAESVEHQCCCPCDFCKENPNRAQQAYAEFRKAFPKQDKRAHNSAEV